MHLRGCKYLVVWTGVFAVGLAGCNLGPRVLEKERLPYNKAISQTTQEQLLLNIVRLRYNDVPTNLAVSTIASQYALEKNIKMLPFFSSTGDAFPRAFSTVLPEVDLLAANRPTMTFTPQDDQDFTKKMFTPISLEGFIYLTKTSWPVSTMFRLWVEKMNWVNNGSTASGPTPERPPSFEEFLAGVRLLQHLEDREDFNFFLEEKTEEVSGPLPIAQVNGQAVVEASKNGFEYRKDEEGKTFTLTKKTKELTLRFSPKALASAEVKEFERIFGLKPGLGKYLVEVEAMDPYKANQPKDGAKILDLELRSLLQVLFYVAQGVEVPPEHAARNLTTITRDHDGRPFDYQKMLSELFLVRSCCGRNPPRCAHVAVCYRGCWFYIDDGDIKTKETFALLVNLARLELGARPGNAYSGPVLTLPIGGR